MSGGRQSYRAPHLIAQRTQSGPLEALTLVFAVLASVAVLTLPYDYPVVFPKLIVIATLAVVLPVGLLWRGLAKPASMAPEPAGLTERSLLTFVLVALVLALLTRFAIQPQHYVAMWGTAGRNISGMLYMALALVVLAVMSPQMALSTRHVHNGALTAGLLTSTYGWVQLSGHDFIMWVQKGPLSTFGNIDHSASWHAIVTVLAVAALLQRDRHWITRALSVVLAILAARIVINLYREPWRIEQGMLLALAGGAALALPLLQRQTLSEQARKRIKILALLLVAALALVFVMVIPTRGFGHRVWLWGSAFRMFLSHPLLGVGLSRYGAYYHQMRFDGEMRAFGPDNFSDDAHGVPVQLLGTGGLLVFIPYMAVMASMLYIAFRALRSTEADPGGSRAPMAVLCGLYWLQASFSPEMSGMSVWGWLAAGTLVGTDASRPLGGILSRWQGRAAVAIRTVDAWVFHPSRLRTVLLGVVAVALAATVSQQVLTEFRFVGLRAQTLTANDEPSVLRDLAMRGDRRAQTWRILQARPGDPVLALQLFRYMRQTRDEEGAWEVAQQLLRIEPRAIELERSLADLAVLLRRRKDAAAIARAVTEQAPRTPMFWVFRSIASAAAADTADARASLVEADRLQRIVGDTNPRLDTARMALIEHFPFVVLSDSARARQDSTTAPAPAGKPTSK